MHVIFRQAAYCRNRIKRQLIRSASLSFQRHKSLLARQTVLESSCIYTFACGALSNILDTAKGMAASTDLIMT